MKYRILVVEDDKDIAEVIRLYLENEGYEVMWAGDGLAGDELAQKEKINLAVVDIMLPKMNGYDLVKKVREQSNIPLLTLSAKNLDSDKILGLDLGADDYMTKPFNPLELVTRVKSNIRRYYSLGSRQEDEEKPGSIWRVGELILDEDSVTLTKNGEQVVITPTEYKMLSLFMKSPGKVFTKQQIYEYGWGEDFIVADNNIMVCISKLRDKLDEDPSKYIKTIRGLGYRLEK